MWQYTRSMDPHSRTLFMVSIARFLSLHSSIKIINFFLKTWMAKEYVLSISDHPPVVCMEEFFLILHIVNSKNLITYTKDL